MSLVVFEPKILVLELQKTVLVKGKKHGKNVHDIRRLKHYLGKFYQAKYLALS